MSNDLTFIANDESGNLMDRFATIIKATQFFDVFVGCFTPVNQIEQMAQVNFFSEISNLSGFSND